VGAPQSQLIDIGGLTRTIKDLRVTLRQQIKAGKITGAEVKEIETKLKEFRSRAIAELETQDPSYEGLGAQLEAAETMSLNRGQRFDRGLIKKFLRMDRELWTSQDMTAIGQMLAVKDTEGFDHFVRVLKESPEADQKLKETFLGLYIAQANKATKDNLPTPEFHARFMREHGWAMERLWGKDKIKTITDAGAFAKEVADSRIRLKEFDSWFENKFGPVFGAQAASNVKAEDLITGVFTGAVKGEDLRSFVSFVSARDAALDTNSLAYYKNGVLDQLRKVITKDGRLDGASMERIIEARKDALDVLFPGFSANFNKVWQAVKLTEAAVPKVAKVNSFESKALEYGLRATVAPPMTREGRVLTLGSFLRSSNYRKQVLDIFTDPEALNKMAQFSDKALTMQQWNNVMAKIVVGMYKND
jgi:hypothetical protein